MNEKYQEYKNSPEYKKQILIKVFLGLLLIVIIICVFMFYRMFDKDTVKYDPKKNYSYQIIDNVVELEVDGKIMTTYKCKTSCQIYTRNGEITGYFNKGKILIQEGLNVFLYDLLNNKKVSDYYNRFDYIYDGNNKELENIKMFKVTDSFNKHGILDLDGKILIDLIYDELGKIYGTDITNYSYAKNYITARTTNKWGIISLTNGKKIIDFQYKDIKVSSYNKLAIKEGNLWSVVDESNKRLISKGYSSVDIYTDYYVVSEAGKAFVIDSLGNVFSNKIDLYYTVDPWATITIKGLSSAIEDGNLYLYVDVPIDIKAGTYKTVKYVYDKENKELEIAE